MGIVVSILGAESTGKSSLAKALHARLSPAQTGEWVVVDEALRQWCEARGRTPRVDEQAEIAMRQSDRIARASEHAHVIADTSALMTAIYSCVLFGDHSLMPLALQTQRGYALTVLAEDDFPWEGGDWQRDGPKMRSAVQLELRNALRDAGIPYTSVVGSVASRVDACVRARHALAPLQSTPKETGLAKLRLQHIV